VRACCERVCVLHCDFKKSSISSSSSLSRQSNQQAAATIRVSVAGGKEVDPLVRATFSCIQRRGGAPPPRAHNGVGEKRKAGSAGHGQLVIGVRPRPRFRGSVGMPGWRVRMPS
jgi:hypothetical protein